MPDREYEDRSLREALAREREIGSAPIADRKEAAADFGKYKKTDPALVAERNGWLLNGSYGYGEMKRAQSVLDMKGRANRAASLVQLVGIYEWMTPVAMTIAQWKKLSAAEKAALDKAVKAEIALTEKRYKDEGRP